MKDQIICWSILCFLFSPCYATDLRNVNINSLAKGNNGVTQSVLYNPAIASLLMEPAVRVDVFNRYMLKELTIAGIGICYPGKRLATSLFISTFGYDEYRETLFRSSLSKQISRKWYLGIAVSYTIKQAIFHEHAISGIGSDIGIIYKPVHKLVIGMLIMNYPSFLLSENISGNKLFNEYKFQIGFQWQVINSMFIIGSIEKNNTSFFVPSFGVEYCPYSTFFLRTGIDGNNRLPALGTGYKLKNFMIDTALSYHTLLGISLGIGLEYRF